MAVRIAIRNGERTVEIEDPAAYDRYLTSVTSRFGNHQYVGGRLVAKEPVQSGRSSVNNETQKRGK